MGDAIAASFYNILSGFLNSLLKTIIWFLDMFVTKPVIIPDSMREIWKMSANISTAVITTAFIYAMVKSSAQSISDSGENAKDIIGRSFVSVFMAQASWTIFAEWLLPLNNIIVSGLMAQFSSIQINTLQGSLLPAASVIGAGAGIAVMGSYFVLVLLASLLAIALVVSIAVLLARNVQIIMLIILAPVAASFTVISGRVNSWRWLITELLSAIFSQAMLILFLFVSFTLMFTGGSVTMDTGLVENGGSMLWNFGLGVTGIFLSFKSHSWLKGMMTGRSVLSDHGGLAMGAGMAMAHSMGNLAPGGLQLSAMQHLGKVGLGDFSKGGRTLMAASAANRSQASEENPGYYSAGVASQANADTAAMDNPHTRSSVAQSAGIKAEVNAQGVAGNAPAISMYQSAGKSAVAHHPGARAAANQANVDSEVAYNQDPQVMASKGVTRAASMDYMRTARSNSFIDQDIKAGGFSDLADTYQSFGYGQEGSGQRAENQTSTGLATQGPRGVSKVRQPNPYTRKREGVEE